MGEAGIGAAQFFGNGRVGDVCLLLSDIENVFFATGAMPRTPTAPLGDASTRIASTMFVDNAIEDLRSWTMMEIEKYHYIIIDNYLGQYAPINSPNLTGLPTGPTANPGTNTGQLATTAFVQAAITASTTGVASFNTRTGAVVLLDTDLTAVGGALLAGPAFTGVPTAPTAAIGTNTSQLATTAFVLSEISAISAGVTSFNTRTGNVVLTVGDVTGTGVLGNTPLTGVPPRPLPRLGPTPRKWRPRRLFWPMPGWPRSMAGLARSP